MWSQELLLVVQALLLFVGLRFFYWIVFKAVQWQSAFMRALVGRVRLPVYLLIPLVTLVWVLRQLAHFPSSHFQPPESILWVSEYAQFAGLTVLVVEVCDAFVFDYLFAVRHKTEVPHILHSLARGIVYVALFLFLLPRVFGWQDLAGLVTSSAILSIILGLALQETLGNLFAGIGMQISRPYTVGNWIRIAAHEGVVERADWRSVTIRTLYGDQVSFPHNLLAKLEIQNYSLPSPLHAREVQVGAHYRHSPHKVEAILLRCARETPGVCPEPLPLVRLSTYQDFAILYTLKFWIDDFARHPDIQSDILKRVWYQFKREGIQIPFPIRDVYHHEGDVRVDTVAETVPILKDIEFLKVLSDEQLHELAKRLDTQIFARGETICRQGEPGETFYIIKNGQVLVTAHNGQGQTSLNRSMGAGDFFGEISLLTGEPRSATVTTTQDTELLIIDKEDMRCMLEANSQLAEYISSILALRQQQLEEQLMLGTQQTPQSAAAQNNRIESLRREFLARIRNFFSY